jgi:hypothetical protein
MKARQNSRGHTRNTPYIKSASDSLNVDGALHLPRLRREITVEECQGSRIDAAQTSASEALDMPVVSMRLSFSRSLQAVVSVVVNRIAEYILRKLEHICDFMHAGCVSDDVVALYCVGSNHLLPAGQTNMNGRNNCMRGNPTSAPQGDLTQR